MLSESWPLPAESVEKTAKILAGRWLWFALIPGVVALLFALTLIAAHDSPRHHPHAIGVVIATGMICVGLPGALVISFLARARRLSRISVLACKPELSWHLVGNQIVASRDGVPRPELTFRVPAYLRRHVTEVPRATLVQ